VPAGARGNADRELVAVRNGKWSDHAETRWAAEQLRPEQVRLLAEPLTPCAWRSMGSVPWDDADRSTPTGISAPQPTLPHILTKHHEYPEFQ
jgi:hypothetical protein